MLLLSKCRTILRTWAVRTMHAASTLYWLSTNLVLIPTNAISIAETSVKNWTVVYRDDTLNLVRDTVTVRMSYNYYGNYHYDLHVYRLRLLSCFLIWMKVRTCISDQNVVRVVTHMNTSVNTVRFQYRPTAVSMYRPLHVHTWTYSLQ